MIEELNIHLAILTSGKRGDAAKSLHKNIKNFLDLYPSPLCSSYKIYLPEQTEEENGEKKDTTKSDSKRDQTNQLAVNS
jgi:hypothetical protein